jgi:PPP family 3-phenylpropionic acid transporter
MRKFWIFAFNVLYFGSFAFVVPFLVLHYQKLQFSGLEIGILMGATPLINLVSAPLFTNLADSRGWHRPILAICVLMAIILIAWFPLVTSFNWILLLIVVLYAFLAPIVPLIDSATMYMLGDEKEMYGRVRLGGTFGWAICASIAGAVVENYSLKLAFWSSAAMLTILFLVSWKMVFQPVKRKVEGQASVFDLLSDSIWIRFLLIAFLGGVTLAVSNNYFFLYLGEIGAPESMMGIALSIGTVMEVPALFFGNRLLAKFTPYRLLLISLLLMGLRLLLFGFVSDIWLVLLIQPLGGLTFVVMWLGGVAYANDNAPESLSSTAQGLFSAMIFGVGSAVGGILGGLLLEQMPVQIIYLYVGLIVFIAPFLIVALWRFVPGEKLKNA